MDEESVGLFGALLLITVLVLSQPMRSQALPRLPENFWRDMVATLSCEKAEDVCYRDVVP